MTLVKAGLAMLAIGALYPAFALAGPCTDDVATLGRQLSGSGALGPVTSGTLSGSNPGAAQTAPADTKGTTASSDQRIGGLAGTKEIDAASSNVATSAADVRRQQAGKPIAAAQAGGGSADKADDDRVSRAKVQWQRAVDLNAQNDPACKGAIEQAQSILKPG